MIILKKNGITLLEILLVLLISSIVLVASFPSFSHLMLSNTSEAGVNNIIAGLNYARNEAITKGVAIKFCKSRNQKDCGGDWRDGQIALVVNTMKVLQVFPALSSGMALRFAGSFGNNDYLIFTPLGTTTAGRFEYRETRKEKYNYDIVISRAGRIRVERQR